MNACRTTTTTILAVPRNIANGSAITRNIHNTVLSDTLRKRFTTKNIETKTTKSKCVQFMPLPEFNDDDESHHTPIHSLTKPLKKIIFNGTFPIDDPYSSRF